MRRRDAANLARLGELVHSVERQHDVDVALVVRPVEVDADVRLNQIVRVDVVGNHPVARVGESEWRIIAPMQRGSRDQGDLRFRQRWRSNPGRGFMVEPAAPQLLGALQHVFGFFGMEIAESDHRVAPVNRRAG